MHPILRWGLMLLGDCVVLVGLVLLGMQDSHYIHGHYRWMWWVSEYHLLSQLIALTVVVVGLIVFMEGYTKDPRPTVARRR
jgi:hypothetical protein